MCLESHENKLYHLGITHGVSRSTLADANEKRDYRIYQDFAQHLISTSRQLYNDRDDTELDLTNNIYAIDASTIDLCLSVFWWAPFRKTKAAIKLHTQIDIKCSIPTFIHVSDGKYHEFKRWQHFTKTVGRLSFFSNGLNNTYRYSLFGGSLKMLFIPKFGLPFVTIY